MVELLVICICKDGFFGYFFVVVICCVDGYKNLVDFEGKVLVFVDLDFIFGYVVLYFNIVKEVDLKIFFFVILFFGFYEVGVVGVV